MARAKKKVDGRSSEARAARARAAAREARKAFPEIKGAELVVGPAEANGARSVTAGIFLAIGELVADGTIDARVAVLVASRLVER